MNILYLKLFAIIGLNLNTLFQKFLSFIAINSVVSFRYEVSLCLLPSKNIDLQIVENKDQIELQGRQLIVKIKSTTQEFINRFKSHQFHSIFLKYHQAKAGLKKTNLANEDYLLIGCCENELNLSILYFL